MDAETRRCGRPAWLAVGVAVLAAMCLLQACDTTVARTRRPPPLVVAKPGLMGVRPSDAALANAYLAHMTLDEKLGQMIVAEFVGPAYTPDNAAMVEQLHAGGILLYNREMPDFATARNLVAAAQAHARLPLFVTVDEEGGWVDRMQDIYGFRPSAEMIAATGSPDYARAQATQVAHDMLQLGLNFDYAPDVDVALVDGPDQSTRTFGSTPEAVTRFAGAYLDGLQSHGVIGCLKHFPGLGAATSDAHLGLPMIYRSRDQIEQVELAPYRNLIHSGFPGCVMSTDLLMPALDGDLPAELSPKIITGVLRQELGYDGVVVTDALYMDGIAQRFSMAQAGVLAVEAGCDFLMGPWDPPGMRAMIDALKAALADGRITPARIDQSVRRLLELKLRFGILSRATPWLGSGLIGAVPPARAPDVALAPRWDEGSRV
jgi:beta-N-acetylhexosaminidase